MRQGLFPICIVCAVIAVSPPKIFDKSSIATEKSFAIQKVFIAVASNADVYTSAIFALQKYLLGTPKPLNCIRRMQAARFCKTLYMNRQFPLLPGEDKLRICKDIIHKSLCKMNAVDDNELRRYVDGIVDNMNREELDALERMPVNFAAKIRAYVMQLQEETARENFYKWLETEKIVCEPRFQLTEYITLPDSTSSMSKSLYQTEGKMDGLEYKMALAMTNMDNIRWWHRNPERNKFSFCLNGFRNHYPDFIVRTISGKIILIETKGDQLENAESREKIRLGRAWQDAAGKQAYRYYMVFQNKDLQMEGAYRLDEFLTLLREL